MKRTGVGVIRLVVVVLWAVLTAGTASADAPWTGDWQLTWSNGGALVSLQQDGSSVGGSFGNGLIRGTARDGQFEGQILYNGQTESLAATLSPDGSSFAGTTESGDWLNGVRVVAGDRQAEPVTIDLSSPRAALRSFLEAASLARSNRTYALSSALDAVDFGSDPGWTSREARFTGAQRLFQLIDRATFNMSTIPDDEEAATFTLSLPQIDSKSIITLDMERNAQGKWHIMMPTPDKLGTALEAAGAETADGYRQMQNPRDTIRAFLDGMQRWQSGGQAQALAAIDLSQVPSVLRETEGTFVAQYLVRILDQVGHRTLQYVPNSGASREPFVFFELPQGRIVIEPVGTGKDTLWKFSAETARDIRALYRAAERLPNNNALDPSFIPESPMFAMRDQVKRFAPFLLHSLPGPGQIEYWQLLASLLLVAAMIVSTLVLRQALLWLLTRQALHRHVANPQRLALALALGVSFLAGSRLVLMLGLPAAARQYTLPVIGTLLVAILAFALWQLVVFVLSVLEGFAEKTDTAFDNILLTFAAGVAKLSIVVATVLTLSYLWSLPTSGLLAGLGISGLAVAFASKETLSNIFGAGILLGDRPFRKGDRIIAGDINGWVEAVGLRSTRIRTIHDSLLVVPNGKLADMAVNNLGARRRRTFTSTLLVTAGATPDRLTALTEGIRERIAANPIFDAASTEVRISRIASDGIEVEISTNIGTRSGRTSREATHDLYLDILRLAEMHGLKLGRGTEGVVPAAAG
ncbi:MAG: mechanosensitive ion channel [Hyphomicrobiales bacterium]|uniref:mechanosensitive ion channel family protein n=1 Tax=Aestuariivirga sp. TaxID=2650926 RepID=UPI0035B4A5D5